MNTLVRILRATRSGEDGQDLIEYAVLLGLITVAVVVVALALGEWVTGVYQDLLDNLQAM